MIYKRAARQLRQAGINHIDIHKLGGGPTPLDTRAGKQVSKCFATWQDAVTAVINGYRPDVEEWREKREVHKNCTQESNPCTKS